MATTGEIAAGLAGEYRIISPALFVSESSDAFATFFLQLRQSLRVAAGEMSSHGFFTGQAQLTAA